MVIFPSARRPLITKVSAWQTGFGYFRRNLNNSVEFVFGCRAGHAREKTDLGGSGGTRGGCADEHTCSGYRRSNCEDTGGKVERAASGRESEVF